MISGRGVRRRRGRVVFGAALDFSARLAGRYRHRRGGGRAGGAMAGAALVWLRPFAWLRRLWRPLAPVAGGAPVATAAAMPVRDGRGSAPPAMRVTMVHEVRAAAALIARAWQRPVGDPVRGRSAGLLAPVLPDAVAHRRARAGEAARAGTGAAPDAFVPSQPARPSGGARAASLPAPRWPARAPVTAAAPLALPRAFRAIASPAWPAPGPVGLATNDRPRPGGTATAAVPATAVPSLPAARPPVVTASGSEMAVVGETAARSRRGARAGVRAPGRLEPAAASASASTLTPVLARPRQASPAARLQSALAVAAPAPLATAVARARRGVAHPSSPRPHPATPPVTDEVRFPVAPGLSPAALGAVPPAAPRPPTGALPLVPRLLPRASTVETLPFLRRREKPVDVREIQETVSRRVEESLHRRVHEDVTQVIARELAPNSPLARRLGDRIYSDLYESLVVEKERLGWG